MKRYRLRWFGRCWFSVLLVVVLTGCPPRDDVEVVLEASPETIVLGESAELRWQIFDGTPPFELSLTPPVAGELVSPLTVSPTVTTTYTLTMNDATGSSRRVSTTVTVITDDPSIDIEAFTAEADGLEVTFTWTLIGETPIACTLDPGDGSEVLELADCSSQQTTYRYAQTGTYSAQLTANGASATVSVTLEEANLGEVGISGFVDEQSRNVVIILTDAGEQTVSIDSLNRNIARVAASYGQSTTTAAIRGVNAAVLGLLQNTPTNLSETPNLLDLSREFVVAVDASGNVLATSRLNRETAARLEFDLALPTEQAVALLVATPDGQGGWVCKGSLEYQRVQDQRTVVSEQVLYRFDNTLAGRDDLQAGTFTFNELTANLAARNDASSNVPLSDEVRAATIPFADASEFQDGIYRFCNNDNLAREDILADLDWRSDIFNVSELPPETSPDLAAGEAAVYDFSVALLLEPQADGSNYLVATSPLDENGNLSADVVRSAADNLDATLFFTDVAFFDASKRRFPLTPTYQFDAQARTTQNTQTLLTNVPESDTIDLGVIDGGLGYISGRVQLDDGTPVPNAIVIIVLDGERLAFNVAVSDENGFYELLIPSDTDNRYLLYAQNAPGTLAGIASNDGTGVRYVVGSSDIFDQDIIIDVPISSDLTVSDNFPIVDAGVNQISNGGRLLLTGTVSDPDGDPLLVRWQVLTRPEGSNPRFGNANAPVTRFEAETPGVYQLRLSAFDGARYAADTVTIRVRSSNPPQVNAGDDTNTTIGIPLTLTGTAFDPDGDTLTFTWQVIDAPAQSNPQLSDPNSQETTFSADVAGSYQVQFSASDGELTVSDSLIIQVVESSDNPPIVNAGVDIAVDVGTVASLEGDASDPDGDPLNITWQVTDQPDNSDVQLSNPNNLTTDFSANVAGTYVLTLTASDGELSASDSLTIQVISTAGLPPLVEAFFEQDGNFLPSDETVVEPSSSVNLVGVISDPDSDTLTIGWQVISAPDGSDPQLSVEDEVVTFANGSGQVATLFSADLAGDYTVRLTAADGAGGISSDILTVIVNTRPIVDAGEDERVTVGSSITLEGSANDPDGDPLTYTWQVTEQPDDGTFQFSNPNAQETTFSADIPGDYVLTLTASDGKLTASDSLTVEVTINNPPQVNIENDDVSITVGSSITLVGNADDPDDDPLTYTWQVTEQPDDGTFQLGNPNAQETTFSTNLPGNYQVEFSASDGELSDSDSITIQVEPNVINNPPQVQAFLLGANNDLSEPDGSTVEINSNLTFVGNVSDPDGDTLTVTWQVIQSPPDSEPQINEDSAFVIGSGQVDTGFSANVAGNYVIRLSASDGEDTGEDSFTVTVNANTPPAVNLVSADGTTVSPFAEVTLVSNATDDDGDSLIVTWEIIEQPFPSNPSLTDTSVESATFSPDNVGDYTIRVTVSDGTTEVTDTLTITVFFG